MSKYFAASLILKVRASSARLGFKFPEGWLWHKTMEVASSSSAFYTVNGSLTPGVDISTVAKETNRPGPLFQVSGGINYSFAWMDNRLATLGVEYFFNQLGYTDAKAYPALIYFGQYRPFYTGKNHCGSKHYKKIILKYHRQPL